MWGSSCHYKKKRMYWQRRMQALLLVLCMVMTSINIGTFSSLADPTVRFVLGENGGVKAVLCDGVLTVSGSGDIYDYSQDNPSPLTEYADEIESLVIEEGVTYIGSYLFYDCQELSGELVLPSSIVSIGDYAFSGRTLKSAPGFHKIENLFEEAELVISRDDDKVLDREDLAEEVKSPDLEKATPSEAAENNKAMAGEETQSEDVKDTASSSDAQQNETSKNNFEETANTLPHEQLEKQIETITEQIIGEEIFYPGQEGIFSCDENNLSFISAMESAGYSQIMGYEDITLDDGSGNQSVQLAPITENGVFLPDFSDISLTAPVDPRMRYQFAGWRANDRDNMPEDDMPNDNMTEDEFLKAYSFYAGDLRSFTAEYKLLFRTQTQQTITAQTPDGLLLEISGYLPEGAEVLAELVTPETAVGLSGGLVPDAGEVIAALDLAILVDGAKYQPTDYGNNVQVQIRNLNVTPSKDQSLSVIHINQDTDIQDEAVEIMETKAVSEDGVAFTAESFSVYIVTVADNYTITFNEGNYILQDTAGYDITDIDSAKDGVQTASSGAFFRFKIKANDGYTVTDVKVEQSTEGSAKSSLYGPNSDGVYTVSNVTKLTGSQNVTIATAKTYSVMYDANGGLPANSTVNVIAHEGKYKLAYPVDIGFNPNGEYHFQDWSTSPDGGGTHYAAGADIEFSAGESASITLYANWSNKTAPFSAVLYDGSSVGGNGTELTEGGAIASKWDYTSAVRVLAIDVEFASKGGQLSITLPTGMALFNDNYTQKNDNTITSVDFKTLTGLEGEGGQGTGQYSNSRTGTLTYTFSQSSVKSERVVIPVTFDQNIWDKETQGAEREDRFQNFTGENPAITVTMMRAGESSYEKTISKVDAAVVYKEKGLYIVTEYNPKRLMIGDTPVSMAYTDIRNLGCFRSVTIEYTLPNDGNGKYAEYAGEDKEISTALKNNYGTVSIDSSDPTKVTYFWENCNFAKLENTEGDASYLLYLAPMVKIPATTFDKKTDLTFDVSVTAVSYMGTVIRKNKTVSDIAASLETGEFSLYQSNSQVCEEPVSSVMSNLGMIGLGNIGLGSSEKLRITYNFDENNSSGVRNNIDVSAFVLPCRANSNFTATCTLADENNANSFEYKYPLTGGTSEAKGAMILARDVAKAKGKENPESWFFKKITYEIEDGIPSKTLLYSSNNPKAFGSPGNLYGKKSSNISARSSILIEEWNGTEWKNVTPEKNYACVTQSATNRVLTMYIKTLQLDNGNDGDSLTITAGAAVTLTAELSMFPYPYGSTQYARKPQLCFIAPSGISIANEDVSVEWTKTGEVIKPVITAENMDSGKTLYRINLENGGTFGGPLMTEEGLIGPEDVPSPKITMKLNTTVGMDALNVELVNQLFAVEMGGSVKIGFGDRQDALDSYDLNNDGRTDDRVGTYTTAKKMKLIINANNNHLNFSAASRLSDDTASEWKTGEENPVYLPAPDKTLDYRVELSNDSGGIVAREDFYYYMPVPKKGISVHGHMMNSKEDKPEFSVNLTGPVHISGDNPHVYEVRYSRNADTHNYSNGEASFAESVEGKTYAKYETAAEITAEGVWDQVNMCKIIATEAYVPTSTQDYFTCTFKYDGTSEDITKGAGDIAVWGSCGYQKYAVDGQEDADAHTPTGMVCAMLRHEETIDLKMTAKHEESNPSNTVESSISLTAFSTVKKLNLEKITPNNVTLESADTIKANADSAAGSVADNNFSIAVRLNDGGLRELSGAERELGSTVEAKASTLDLVLTFYSQLSDVTTDRSVTVLIGDGEGVAITLNITIVREPTAITDPKPAVDSGKRYGLITGTGTPAITQNSAVTAQYVYEMNPSQCKEQKLSLMSGSVSADFPKGATIAMLDFSSPAGPGYYYYNVDSDNLAEISLSDFRQMGDETPYNDPSTGNEDKQVSQELVFVLDFAYGQLDTGTYQLTLSTDTGAMQNTNFEVTPIRTFGYSSTAQASMVKSLSISGDVTAGAVEGADTAYQHKKMALEVSLLNEDGSLAAMPEGTLISMNSKIYTPTAGVIILPLGGIESQNFKYSFETPHTYLEKKVYILRTRLLISATSDNTAPCGGTVAGENTLRFSADPPAQYALTVAVTSGEQNRIFSKDQAKEISFELKCNEAAKNSTVTLEIQEKIGEIYITRPQLIQSVTDEKNGDWSGPNAGVVSSYGRTAADVTPILHLYETKLNEGGTYRLLFKVLGANKESISVPYNIIITAD